MQRIILRFKPEYGDTWRTIQQRQAEDLPFKYLARILPGAKILQHVYYRGTTDAGIADWCEADGLLIYDDHLFVIESRGGAFTHSPPATDFTAYIASLKNLVLKPATQGRRFVDYLKSAERVALYDEKHREIAELRGADFRHVSIFPVTLDPFIEMAAQVQHLRKIGVDVGFEPIWAMSLDDLRVYADIFEDPLFFLHYAEQRAEAFKSDVIQSDDELDHLGLYLKHNHYSSYARQMQEDSGARITFHGYRSEVDKFFRQRMFDPTAPCPLKQDIPARILEVIEFLSTSDKAGRAAISSCLLDMDGEWRQTLSACIDDELTRQAETKRPKPYSTHGGAFRATVCCWVDAWVPRNPDFALDHARTVSLVNNDERRLLLELSYTASGVLRDVHWNWVQPSTIPAEELPKLRAKAEQLAHARVEKARAERKIGRNDPCPCGSGKKYKKCHLPG